MFKENNRYITRDVNDEMDIRLQLIMWSLIDKLNNKKAIKVDYLQVFRLRKEGTSIVIEHTQEEPEYKEVYLLKLEGLELNSNKKIYVIDSGEYSTMLLPQEY